MKETEQEQNSQANAKAPATSPLVMDRTYGERIYDFTFGTLINFWVNLFASAAFSFWVVHSSKPLFGKEPRAIHEGFKNWLSKTGFMKGAFSDAETRINRAGAMANALMLGIPGHVLMIPNIWLGSKIKGDFVRYFDKMHYGADSEADPTLAERHRMIDQELKPTLLGATLARVGTIFASEGTAFLIGSKNNFISKQGKPGSQLSKFGVDDFAEEVGNNIGDVANKTLHGPTEKINNWGSKQFSWSNAQIEKDPSLKGTPYTGTVKDFSRYTVTDILYTVATAVTIDPLFHLIKHIPGMSYRESPSHRRKREAQEQQPITVSPQPAAANAPAKTNDENKPNPVINTVESATPLSNLDLARAAQ